MHLIVLIGIIVCGMFAFCGLREGVGNNRSDITGGAIVFLIVAIALLIILGCLPDVYPTCTLEGLI